MYQDNLFNELIIDNFAGGGGASVGIELAVGRPVDIAINHDADAIAMHSVNHPYTAHYQEDVFAIDPMKVTGGRPVGIAWFSPDCRHFSRAKGNKPVERKIRGLSWVILKWAMSDVAPRCIFMENVEEIQSWGPLIPDPKDPEKLIPDPERVGETFKGFIAMLTTGISPDHSAFIEACEFLNIEPNSAEAQKLVKGLGYNVDYRTLRACDYGAPTIRKRFTLVARNDGKPIVWPKATHGKGRGLKPYRTAAECIDWSKPCPSIFERKKPLVENTLKRVARGLDKFVIKNPKPYILEMNYDNQLQDVDKPMSTQTGVNKHFVITPNLVECSHKSGPGVHNVTGPPNTVTGKACFGLSTPYMIPIGYGENKSQAPRLEDIHKPLNTIVSSNKHYVTAPFLSKYFGGDGSKASGTGEPVPTVTAKDHNALIAANIVHYYGGEDHASSADSPVPTVTVEPRHYLCSSNLCVLRRNMDGKSLDEPIPTLTSSGGHFAEVRTHFIRYTDAVNVGKWPKVRELLNKYCGYNLADNEIILFEIRGVFYYIDDIGMRMLEPEELKLAQGFPVDYIIDIESYIGKKYSKAKQIARLGNAVCPPLATALVRANLPELCWKQVITTVADLERVYARSC